jgi:peptidyl-prolyl cis-trans isomerase SurA
MSAGSDSPGRGGPLPLGDLEEDLRSTPLRLTATVVAVLLSLILFACSSKPNTADTMAKVNGKKISRAEVDKYFNNQTAGAPQPPAGEQADALRLNILRDLIDSEILMQRAEKDGLLATDDEVQRKLTELKAPYTDEEFQKRLQDRRLTQDDLRQELRRSLTIDKVMNKEITSKIEIRDPDVERYYEQHKAEFNLIEPQYHLARILVTTSAQTPARNQRNSKAQNEAEAAKKIRELLNRLDSGEDFGTLAMNFSEDPDTAMNGGDLGSIPESGLKNTDAASRDAVLKLKPGQYSGIITLSDPRNHQVFGFQIVRLIDRVPAGQRDLKDPRVQQYIRDRLRESSEQLRKAAFYEVLHNQAKIENYFAVQVMKNAGK